MSHVETITEAADFSASAAAVWELLTDWPAIIDWMPDGYIKSLECEGQGPGMVRHLVTRQGAHVSERLDSADDTTGELQLSLVGELPWGLISYTARGKVDALVDGRSRLIWQGTLETAEAGEEFDRVSRLLRKSYRKMLQGVRQAVES